MKNVIIVGGGASGMMAAIMAARGGVKVTLLEKNEKLGKKLYITGKGRCNLTNNCEVEELLSAVCVNQKFLYSSFYGFTSQDTIGFFEGAGMPTKTERGNRVYPVSDHSSDVIAALTRELKKAGVVIRLYTEVKEILTEGENEYATGVQLSSGEKLLADAVVIATGGISYRSTGSTGDGYHFAKETGHTVTECFPSLVPIETLEDDAPRMQGLSLRNVKATVFDGKKELYQGFGEMMFTHFGVTGPLILTASTKLQKRITQYPLKLVIDLKPALSYEQLDTRILREFETAKNKQFKNILQTLFPTKMIPIIIDRTGIPGEKLVHSISKEERHTLVDTTKSFTLTLTKLRDYNEAIITRGGVSVRDINPTTMESKHTKNLYFVGEILDLDAVTGGFNLQIAWATGYACGTSVAAE